MWLSIGSLTMPAPLVAIASAFLLTIIVWFILKKKSIADYYSNVIVVFILTWKLSVVLFQFKLSVQNPFTILYFNGGIRGYWLGIIASIIYILITSKRRKDPLSDVKTSSLFQSWLMTASFYELIISIVNGHNVWMMVILILTNILFMLMTILKNDQIQWQYQLVILFTVVQVLIYSIKDNFLSIPIITYILLAIFLSILRKKEV